MGQGLITDQGTKILQAMCHGLKKKKKKKKKILMHLQIYEKNFKN